MKKTLLALFVILTFTGYAIYKRNTEASSASSVTSSPGSITGLTVSPAKSQVSTQGYKDGAYTGDVTDAYYGNIQVKAIIQGGKIMDVQFLQYPNDRSTSREINAQAMPYLKSEALQAQSADVNIISGATDSSRAFVQSLRSALLLASN